jgi:hypothetical protein
VPNSNPQAYTCGPPAGGCSDEFEPCMTAADCCTGDAEAASAHRPDWPHRPSVISTPG